MGASSRGWASKPTASCPSNCQRTSTSCKASTPRTNVFRLRPCLRVQRQSSRRCSGLAINKEQQTCPERRERDRLVCQNNLKIVTRVYKRKSLLHQAHCMHAQDSRKKPGRWDAIPGTHVTVTA